MSVANLLTQLSRSYPSDRLMSDPSRLAPYESDALTAFSARPEAVVLASSREEVIDLVRACQREDVPFVARGSGTSLSGGSLPVKGGIVIGLNRLNRVLRVDPRDRIAVVEPGVTNAQVSDIAKPYGLLYAPDPSSQQVCTIGGNVAFNSGGAHCLKHGMTSNHVLEAEVVLPDGEVVRLGSGSAEPSGPDWLGLFVGSEGLFGIALEVTLRLLTTPEHTRTVLAGYPSLEAAGEAVAATIAAGIVPVAMEIMDSLAITAAESSVSPGYPAVPALLIAELDGEREAVETDFELLEQVIRDSGATEIRTTSDPLERAMIWKGRKSAFSAVGWLTPDYLVQDGCVPRTRLGEALAEIERLSADHGLQVANVFHAGDGNLHPLILFDGREAGAVDRAHALAGEILDLCISLGGSITGEHGVGVEKREFLERMFAPADIDMMRRLRAAIDPAKLSNRGKMLPPARDQGDRDAAGGSSVVAAETGGPDVERDPRVTALREAILEARLVGAQLLPQGQGTKPALSDPADGETTLDVSGLSGIVRHDPGELTLTALGGTPISEIAAALAEHGQYLPFDPPLAAAGATVGGVVASGTSGPGRHRHGGVRDFVLSARFACGTGEVIRGGARVVKNAAGFDLPKLLVGSIGRLGVILELTLKVLPAPPAWATVEADVGHFEAALAAVARLETSGLDIEALDLEPPGKLWIRLGGRDSCLSERVRRVERELGVSVTRLVGAAEDEPWSAARELGWAPPGTAVAKLALLPGSIATLDLHLADAGIARRYSAGGHLGWIAMPVGWPRAALDATLRELAIGGVWLTGPRKGSPLTGRRTGGAFANRVRHALDPDHVFASCADGDKD